MKILLVSLIVSLNYNNKAIKDEISFRGFHFTNEEAKEKNGQFISYYENGKINYKDSKMHGESIFYYENGIIDQKANYIEDELLGFIKYNNNGDILLKENYNKEGDFTK